MKHHPSHEVASRRKGSPTQRLSIQDSEGPGVAEVVKMHLALWDLLPHSIGWPLPSQRPSRGKGMMKLCEGLRSSAHAVSKSRTGSSRELMVQGSRASGAEKVCLHSKLSAYPNVALWTCRSYAENAGTQTDCQILIRENLTALTVLRSSSVFRINSGACAYNNDM